jgi:hypothetical protein
MAPPGRKWSAGTPKFEKFVIVDRYSAFIDKSVAWSRGEARKTELPGDISWPVIPSEKMVPMRESRNEADKPSHRGILSVLAIVVLSVFAAQCVPALLGELKCAGVQVFSNELTLAEAEDYCRYAVSERKKVEGFWGATCNEPIRINVSSSYRISRALVPAYFGNRGFMEMPLRTVRNNTSALLHEIVHIYAPSSNRFLAEGLAVYLHTKLAGNPAFPNFAEALPRVAARSLSAVNSLEPLNRVQTPRPLTDVMDERIACVLAGAFVEFLIDRYGLVSFRSLYETDNYEKAYGKSLQALEKEWRLTILETSR